MEGVALDATVFRMPKRMGVYGQEINSAIGEVAIFHCDDLAEKCKAAPSTFRISGWLGNDKIRENVPHQPLAKHSGASRLERVVGPLLL